jgi:hypothetical protein
MKRTMAGKIVTAAGAIAGGMITGGLIVKKKMDEEAFRRALVRGIRDVAGSGIATDPHESEEACAVPNT